MEYIDEKVRALHRQQGSACCNLYEYSLAQLRNAQTSSELEAFHFNLAILRKVFLLSFPTRQQTQFLVEALDFLVRPERLESSQSIDIRFLLDSYLLVLTRSVTQATALPELVELSKAL